jgi:carboxypeptidase Taq
MQKTNERHRTTRGGKSRRSIESKLDQLRARFREIADLDGAASLLSWDQATYMPPEGALARGRQSALLRKIAHEKSIEPALGKLIDELLPWAEALDPDSIERNLLRVAHRDFEKASKVPPEFIARTNAHAAASYDAWTRARPNNDFAEMVPFLEKTLEFSREYAGFFSPYRHVADPLIDDAEEGMTAASIGALFAQLRRELVPMVAAIADQPGEDTRCIQGALGEEAQIRFGLTAAERMGYELRRGRLDKTHHPFCTRLAHGDVRITTRLAENDIGEGLFSTLHEAGHGMYEQGVDAAFDGTPLGHGVSAGVHESQSRLWENIVGRSRVFWNYHYPQLQLAFADQFAKATLEEFYRSINKVQRSLIRTDADEVTYNLHIMFRFDLELALLEGKLQVKDLPEAWNEGMRANLGIVPPNDSGGCLQDVHWFSGWVGGAFQSYTIGNILSAQFYAAALAANPEIPREIEAGNFAPLHGWLARNVYRHGRKYSPTELVERATASPMRIEPYMAYLRGKYGELYAL